MCYLFEILLRLFMLLSQPEEVDWQPLELYLILEILYNVFTMTNQTLFHSLINDNLRDTQMKNKKILKYLNETTTFVSASNLLLSAGVLPIISNILYIGLVISRSSALPMNLLLIFDMHDLKGEFFLKASISFI